MKIDIIPQSALVPLLELIHANTPQSENWLLLGERTETEGVFLDLGVALDPPNRTWFVATQRLGGRTIAARVSNRANQRDGIVYAAVFVFVSRSDNLALPTKLLTYEHSGEPVTRLYLVIRDCDDGKGCTTGPATSDDWTFDKERFNDWVRRLNRTVQGAHGRVPPAQIVDALDHLLRQACMGLRTDLPDWSVEQLAEALCDDGKACTTEPALRVLTHAQMLDRLLGTDEQVTRVLVGRRDDHPLALSELRRRVNATYIASSNFVTWCGPRRNIDLRFYDPTTVGGWSPDRSPGPCAIFYRLDCRGQDLVLPPVREGDTLYLVLPLEPQVCDDGKACTKTEEEHYGPGINKPGFIPAIVDILRAIRPAKAEIEVTEDELGQAVRRAKVTIG